MKKLLSTYFVIFLAVLTAHAQDRQISLGLDLGLASTQVINSNEKSVSDSFYKAKVGWNPNIGLNLKFRNDDAFIYSYGLGIYYTGYSNKYSGDYSSGGIVGPDIANKEGNLKLNYLAIPIHLEFNLYQNTNATFYMGLAYVPHFKMKYTERFKQTNSATLPSFEHEWDNDIWKTYTIDADNNKSLYDSYTLKDPMYNNTMHSIKINLGVDYMINKNYTLGIHLDYMRSINDIENKSDLTIEYLDNWGQPQESIVNMFEKLEYKWTYSTEIRPASYWSYLGGGLSLYYNF